MSQWEKDDHDDTVTYQLITIREVLRHAVTPILTNTDTFISVLSYC